MIPVDKLKELFPKYGFDNTQSLYLVENPKIEKDGGVFDFNYIVPKDQYDETKDMIESFGILTFPTFFPEAVECIPENISNYMAKFKKMGFDFSVHNGQEGNFLIHIKNHKQATGMYFWRPEKKLDVPDNWKFDLKSFGKFLNYPKCCIDKFADTEHNFSSFKKELNKKVNSEGIESVEYLVGANHVPCSVDCKETKRRDFGSKIKKDSPLMYSICLNDLMNQTYD